MCFSLYCWNSPSFQVKFILRFDFEAYGFSLTVSICPCSFGSFFGPSEPVISHRVIQESKSLLENPNLAAKVMKSNHSVCIGFQVHIKLLVLFCFFNFIPTDGLC